ncbi:helix-turn-helix transcriptional regulator [Paenibacillus albicereus]|uniref:Helix-turn-helix transcriptional regulator n=1 Tax=Paenibacillus albicereus TaxID=2726185 RepID=A0A6H2H231_9BACL|nr:helix-turn-helix transcriptional regulator [Paenibacillus albicereus]QJC53707.1 helix-turn-helix transcriptional regulator [Paenibacillus albicereus]
MKRAEGTAIKLSTRQKKIVETVRRRAPITGEQIAERLGVTRPAIRSDLGLLVMLGYLDAKPKVGYFLGSRDESESERTADSTVAAALLPLGEVMSVPVVQRETATVSDAVVTLFLENVGSLTVVDEAGRLAGIVSRKDLLKVALGNPQAAAMPLGLVMTRLSNLATVTPEQTVREAMAVMIAREIDGLPVVRPLGDGPDAGLEVVGRITKTTVTRLFYEASAES